MKCMRGHTALLSTGVRDDYVSANTNLYGAYGRDRDTFDILVVLSVNLTTAWSCRLGSSTFALSNAKDYTCIGNIVLEKRARKQAQVTLTMASLLGIFLERNKFVKLDTVRVYCVQVLLPVVTWRLSPLLA